MIGAVLSVLLTSCGTDAFLAETERLLHPWEMYFRELYGAVCADLAEFDLREFKEVPPSVDAAFHLSPDERDTAITGTDSILVNHPHRETASGERENNPAPTAAGYVRAEILLRLDEETAKDLLGSLGVTYSVERQSNPIKEGSVFAVEYAGVGTADAHYINPAVPVTLYVSGEKPRFPEATEANTVYLTFDDGPSGEGTLALLDILDCYGIKGTFFLLGDGVKKDPEGAAAIYERGHDIACHSMTHVYKTIYASADDLMAEVDEWTELMESIGVDFDETPKLFRYPGGSVSSYLTAKNRKAMDKALEKRGFLVYDWTVVVNDALLFQCPGGTLPHKYIIDNFIETYRAAKKKGEPIIVLFHDNVPETRSVLPWIIEYLMEDGCTFAPLSERETQWTFADR